MRKYWLLSVLLSLAACDADIDVSTTEANDSPDEFVERLNTELAEMGRENGAANWVRATYINFDTAILSAAASERYSAWHSKSVEESLKFSDADMSELTARSLKQLKLGTSEPAPNDPAKRRELAAIMTDMAGTYGAGKYCPDDGRECMSLNELENVLAASRDYDAQLDAWQGWREVAKPLREKYARFVELSNEGANELGYGDLGQLWRDGYDMTPAEFETETARLWQQVKPLYDALHCHVRAELSKEYGEDKVPLDGPIPAHLLGNMWAQEWGEIYD
ncbi:MAG: M2 family metallopeptidase, partial [Woeseia sp.]